MNTLLVKPSILGQIFLTITFLKTFTGSMQNIASGVTSDTKCYEI